MSSLFTRLQTRLTVLYAALFGVVLLALSGAVYLAATQQAKVIASQALSSSGEVFDRVWALRAERLQSGAAVLARDFGFREALASRDAPTIESAVDNLPRPARAGQCARARSRGPPRGRGGPRLGGAGRAAEGPADGGGGRREGWSSRGARRSRSSPLRSWRPS